MSARESGVRRSALRRRRPIQVIKDWVKDSPAWAISIGLHLALLLGATLVYIEHYLSSDEGEVVIKMRAPKIDKIKDLGGPDENKPPDDPEKGSEDPALAESQDPGDADADSLDLLAGLSEQGRNQGGTVLGVVGPGGDGRVGFGQRPKKGPRRVKATEKPVEEAEDGVRAALRWLARHQGPDGSWSVTEFHQACGRHGFKEDCSRNAFPGNEQYDVGVTALALLAFLGAGHLPSDKQPVFTEGPEGAGQDAGELSRALGESRLLTYGEVVKRALKHLARAQAPGGMIGPEVDRFIYNHLIATLALCEASGMTGVDYLREHAARAIQYVVEARSPRGGWRYSHRSPDTDSSVTGWAMMALHSAETAGIAYDRSIHDDVRRWFEAATVKASIDPKLLDPRREEQEKKRELLLTGYLGAQDAGKLVTVPGVNDDYHYTPALTAIMVMCGTFMDRKPGPKSVAAIDTLLAFPPSQFSPGDQASWKRADFYYWHHATYALFQATGAGDDRWLRWSEAMKSALADTQNLKGARGECREGSWEPVDRWSCEGGRVYATAMAALTLQVCHRYPRLLALDKKLRIEIK